MKKGVLNIQGVPTPYVQMLKYREEILNTAPVSRTILSTSILFDQTLYKCLMKAYNLGKRHTGRYYKNRLSKVPIMEICETDSYCGEIMELDILKKIIKF